MSSSFWALYTWVTSMDQHIMTDFGLALNLGFTQEQLLCNWVLKLRQNQGTSINLFAFQQIWFCFCYFSLVAHLWFLRNNSVGCCHYAQGNKFKFSKCLWSYVLREDFNILLIVSLQTVSCFLVLFLIFF